jgi:ATP-binding cassette subfamily B protein
MRWAIRSTSSGRRNAASWNTCARSGPAWRPRKRSRSSTSTASSSSASARWSQKFYEANARLAGKRAFWGTLLAALGTLGYYVAYAYIAWRTVRGDFSIGDLTFLAGSFRRLRQLLESLLVGFSQVAGQALYLDDLYSFFEIEPEIRSKPDAIAVPDPIRRASCSRTSASATKARTLGAARPELRTARRRSAGPGGRERRRQDHPGETAGAPVRPDEGRILLDGRDLRDYDLDDLRANIGVIFQDFVRYHLTAARTSAWA